jgi:DegV family protein with EDD domain
MDYCGGILYNIANDVCYREGTKVVKIISDSTCDLSEELLTRYDISILPLHIILGEEEFLDGKNITPDEIYRWADANNTTPKTSAPSIADAVELMEPFVRQGMEIVCFSISESMSTSAQVMRIAAEELDAADRVTVIDSANLSTGIGLLVVEAAVMAKNGKSAAEIAAAVEKLKPQVRASFVVDTLVYLYRGGRCGGLSALLGGALRLHPEIVVEDGAMHPAKKYRGKMKNVVLSYAKDREDDLRHARKERVFITHSGCDREIVEDVRKYLQELDVFQEIHETRAGGVVSSHCGPGTLGVLFIEE